MNESIIFASLFGIGFLSLIGLLIYQQCFYNGQIRQLVDRLMARSLGEFERAKNPPPRRVVTETSEPEENLDRILG